MNDFLKHHKSDAVLLVGMTAIAIGTGMIYLPAGVISGGVLAIVWWILDSLGADKEDLP